MNRVLKRLRRAQVALLGAGLVVTSAVAVTVTAVVLWPGDAGPEPDRASRRAAPPPLARAPIPLEPVEVAASPPRRASGIEPRRGEGAAGDSEERALVAEIEQALGARVRVRWDGDRPFEPRSVAIEGARARIGSPIQVASEVVAALTDALGDRTVVLAAGSVAPLSGRVFVAGPVVEDAASAISSLALFADGLAVEDATIRVELRASSAWIPVRVAGRFHLGAEPRGVVSPAVEAALDGRAATLEGSRFAIAPARRLVVAEAPSGEHRRAFEVTTALAPGDVRRELVDAETGKRLGAWSVACSATARALAWEHDPGDGAREAIALGELYVAQGAKRVTTKPDGTFALTGQVSLPEGFAGPLVRVLPERGDAFSYEGPADFTLLPKASDAKTVHQDEASAFFEAVSYNEYLRETYPALAKAAKTRFAVVVGASLDNAFFSPTPVTLDDGERFPGYLELGTIDDHSAARDGSVVQHEYTHAMLSGVVDLNRTDEAVGINEGLADYFPCARAEDPRVGHWLHAPYIRALDDKPKKLVFPKDDDGDPHRLGNIFNQALWRVRTDAEKAKKGERLRIDQVVMGGVMRMPDNPSLADAREAILAADQSLEKGAHAAAFEAAFDDHGVGVGVTSHAPKKSADDAADVKFTAPKKHSYVVHVGDEVSVAFEATSGSGAKVTLAAAALAHASFTKHAGATAKGTLVYEPTDDDRGRHEVTVTATSSGGTTSTTLTFVVRRYKQ